MPARSTSQRRSEPFEVPPSSTPAAPVASAASSFTFETPSPSNARGTRTRTRNGDGANASPEDATSKGGRSLRKRTRVDYSFDQADEEEATAEAKTTPTAARSLKKRRTESLLSDQDFDEDLESSVKAQSSELPPKSVGRRSLGRKSTAEPHFLTTSQPDANGTVHETIEVGGQQSQQVSQGSSRRRSSNASRKVPASTNRAVTQTTPAAVSLAHSFLDGNQVIEETEAEAKPDPTQELQFPKIEIDEAISTIAQHPEIRVHEDTPASSPAPADVSASALPVVDNNSDDPYARLTPYVPGATTLFPVLQATAPAPSAEPDGPAEEVTVEDILEDPNEVPDDSTPAGSPVAAEDTAANSPAPDVGLPDVPATIPKKQYVYKKLRPAQEFIDFIADYETLPIDELWARLDHLTDVLGTVQTEHNKCRKIIDDEENSVRNHQEEALFQHRVKLARSKDPNADPVRKDFVVKGIRAPKQDSLIEYARQQDRVMANAYGFEYDDRDSKISQQDPIGQRGGIGKGRLRDRPKQTAKAAEADDPAVVHGKRSRKAPNFLADFEPASRASTPAPVLPKKRRGRQPLEATEEPQLSTAVGDTPLEESPKKRGKGGRPRKHPLPVVVPEDSPAPEFEQEPEVQDESRTTRKRRRRNVEEDELPANGTSSQALPGVSTRRRNSRLAEIPSSSFYSMASTQPNDDSRPNTSSSTGTVSTTTSNYGLREKRQKKFSLNDDDGDFEDEDQPKPKRIRRVPKKVQEEDFANIPASNIPDMEASAVAVPKTPKIRVKGFTPAAPAIESTASWGGASVMQPLNPIPKPNPSGQIVNGDSFDGLPEDNKGYGQMTKSEKMSASMKARWASGSMSNAVAKRRATLAAKKASRQTPAPERTPEVASEQQGQLQ